MSSSPSSTPEIYRQDPGLDVISASTTQRKRRKRDQLPKAARDSTAPKNCVICGGPTKHYHYEVASCYSCKSFFRRTVVKRVVFTCKKAGKCEVLAGKSLGHVRFLGSCTTLGDTHPPVPNRPSSGKFETKHC